MAVPVYQSNLWKLLAKVYFWVRPPLAPFRTCSRDSSPRMATAVQCEFFLFCHCEVSLHLKQLLSHQFKNIWLAAFFFFGRWNSKLSTRRVDIQFDGVAWSAQHDRTSPTTLRLYIASDAHRSRYRSHNILATDHTNFLAQFLWKNKTDHKDNPCICTTKWTALSMG